MPITRRQFTASLAAAAASLTGCSPTGAEPTTTRPSDRSWLLFTKSSGFEHDVVKQKAGEASYLCRQLRPIFAERGIRLEESKDGRLFEPAGIAGFEGFVFYTTEDLTIEGKDKQPPISAAGKQAFLDAVEGGTPFIGLHCASNTFQSGAAEPSPFTRLIGGEFESHGEQQPGTARIADNNFVGIGEQAEWSFTEEWYALKNIAPDIRPIHVLETRGMKGAMYQREPFPITWTRQQGKGRIFYTALGHREDVIASAAYRRLIGGAIDWCRTR